jgi:hypothetical protein
LAILNAGRHQFVVADGNSKWSITNLGYSRSLGASTISPRWRERHLAELVGSIARDGPPLSPVDTGV